MTLSNFLEFYDNKGHEIQKKTLEFYDNKGHEIQKKHWVLKISQKSIILAKIIMIHTTDFMD